MPTTKKLAARKGDKKGNFADQRNGLLDLFSDVDGCGTSSWRESFGYERRPVKLKGGQAFIAREEPGSSSGSK